MGFWDRPFKKIVDEAPPAFSTLSAIALDETERRIAKLGVRLSTHKQDMKTAVLAALAIASNREIGTWSATAIREATRRGDFSVSQLPLELLEEVRDIVDFIWGTFRFSVHPPKHDE